MLLPYFRQKTTPLGQRWINWRALRRDVLPVIEPCTHTATGRSRKKKITRREAGKGDEAKELMLNYYELANDVFLSCHLRTRSKVIKKTSMFVITVI